MKLKVSEVVNILKGLDQDSEILVWYRTREDVGCSADKWSSLEDESESLDEVIDEYVAGWLED